MSSRPSFRFPQMQIPFYHIDAFARTPFTGNPAGVCLLENWPDELLLQQIAAENNLSETAFLVQAGQYYELRWFTPTREIDLCGHATLAAAFVLNLIRQDISPQIHFKTRSGMLSVAHSGDLLFLDFPARPALPCDLPEGLIPGLGAEPYAVYKSRDYLAVFESEEEIVSLKPDFTHLARLECLGIIATAPGREVDFVSRFFAPSAGVPEDPVTGSSHCTLIPYWAEQTGRERLVARQLSKRGGELVCENKGERVLIGGSAVLYKSGMIEI